ncbi:MAG: hypothetical protein ACRDFW_12280 [bacterium]
MVGDREPAVTFVFHPAIQFRVRNVQMPVGSTPPISTDDGQRLSLRSRERHWGQSWTRPAGVRRGMRIALPVPRNVISIPAEDFAGNGPNPFQIKSRSFI